MALHTYDEEVDALQVDVNADGLTGRVEILYPSLGDVDLEALGTATAWC